MSNEVLTCTGYMLDTLPTRLPLIKRDLAAVWPRWILAHTWQRMNRTSLGPTWPIHLRAQQRKKNERIQHGGSIISYQKQDIRVKLNPADNPQPLNKSKKALGTAKVPRQSTWLHVTGNQKIPRLSLLNRAYLLQRETNPILSLPKLGNYTLRVPI
jgi:hypothetical protein